MIAQVDPAADPAAERRRLGLRWWREVLYVLAFYVVYSAIRNRFGSAAVSPETAFEHARAVIGLERGLGLYFEESVQAWFVVHNSSDLTYAFTGAAGFLHFWNVFYGTFHFVVTGVVLIWVFRSFPSDYPKWRNVLAFTTGLALVGFSLYPLMPPRLLADCGPYGACASQYGFVDSLKDVGGLWSFDSGTMQKVSNQYAAMPSLHFAWATWSLLVIYPRARSRLVRALAVIYPLLTLWAIVVTANHYWIDAVGGALILALGYLSGSALASVTMRRREMRALTGVGEEAVGDDMVGSRPSGYRSD